MSATPDASISSTTSLAYWNSIPTTVDGMLGGYPQISRVDLKGSANFLAKLQREHPTRSSSTSKPTKLLSRGADCGAGIGRVTAGLLSTICEIVDVVEPVDKFAQEAKMNGKGVVGNVYVSGLEDWRPEERYELIWNQWCVGYLKDEQLVDYLRRCKEVLTADGWIVLKENISTNADKEDIYDEMDSSVTRTNEKFQQLFKEADVRLVKTEIQKGFPKGLYPVRLYALRP